MKQRMILLVAALSLTALMSAGCANKEAVKTEEPAAVTAKTDASTSDAAKAAAAAKPVQQPYFKNEENKIEPAKPSDTTAATAAATASIFDTVYFDFDKSDLSQDARNALTKNAEVMLKSKQGAKIKIEGHCDDRGSAEYNLALGERRAKSALQYLITLGVQPERLSIISYGKEKPAVQGNDEAAWAKNRRAEFIIDK
jgi:peptidoglycan-associated lipoprotein